MIDQFFVVSFILTTMKNSMDKTKKWKTWLSATRPKTLAAALAPVLIGIGLAWRSGTIHINVAFVTLLCASLIQIGTNFANDYYDFIKGADTDDRIGFERATAKGLISPSSMRNATFITMFIAFLCGLVLVWHGGIIILVIGILSILFGIGYTGGPYPLGYNGLGDIFVFIFFGVVAVTGTYFLQTGEWSLQALIISLPVGALSVNILVVNNLRDVNQDRVVGKRTLGVLFGENALKAEYLIMLLLAFAIPVYLFTLENFGVSILSSLLLLPLAYKLFSTILLNTHKPLLNNTLERTAQFLALYSIIFTLSIVYS